MLAGTEENSARWGSVETWSDEAILGAIVNGQAAAVEACRAAAPAIARAARLLAATWTAGGRIAYAGAGSSGLIALLDALELPVTYGLDTDRLPVLRAGGGASLGHLHAGSEDDASEAAGAVAGVGLGPGDALVAVSASGSTPYTLAVARSARERGVKVVGIACEMMAPLLEVADVAVPIASGPEIVAGSTRMNAGTAQKCALNMLSTLTAMRLHHVYDGMMVNVRPANARLQARALEIVAQAAGVTERVAQQALEDADGSPKLAVLIAHGVPPVVARRLLAATSGDLRSALDTYDQSPDGRAGR